MLLPLPSAGWYGSAFWLAVAIGAQLLLGGLGAVWIIGPANARLGFARYATLAAAAVALTVFGRLTVGSIGIGLVPIAAVLLWVVIWLELAVNREGRGGLALELALIGIVFAGAAGIATLIGREGWGAVIALTLFHTPEAAAAVVRAGADVLIGKDNFVVGLRQALADLFPAALAA
mgnify:CR=1 FL=1